MHSPRVSLGVLLISGVAAAQSYTAHPIDNPASGITQNIPFAGNNTVWDEARSQFLWLAPFLPTTGGAILGIQLVPNRTATTPYEQFEIWMDHTTNSRLSTTFANNLTSPQLVYTQSPGAVSWTGGTWSTIQFMTPFVYNGASNLVMEVRKKIDRPNNPPTSTVSHRVLIYPRRNDLPTPIWAWGTYGSGAVNATTALTTYSTQVLIRLQWAANRTLVIDSTRNAGQNYYHLGATWTATTQGMSGEPFVDAISVGLLPAGVTIPGVGGQLWLLGPVTLGFGVLDPAGLGSMSMTIPNNAGLVGLRGYLQSGTLGSPIVLTNAVDFVIEP